MLAGTSFVALEERLLLEAQPIVEVTGGFAPIGGQAQIAVTFDNAALSSDTNVGYAPFIDLVLPKRGADGAAPGTVPSQPDDGVTFASATYLGAELSRTVLTFNAAGNTTHPLLRDANNNPVVVNAATYGARPGDQLVILELPFGSFVPDQPKVTVNVTANVSNLADLGTALPVAARGGFAFGKDPLDNPATDAPFAGTLASSTITPTVLTVTKTYNGPEGETATGPNFARSFTIRLDVVTGQTVSNISLVDRLPDGIVVSGAPTLSGATGTVSIDASAHTITATIAGPLLGVNGAEVTMTVPFYVRDTLAPGQPDNPVLDPLTGAPRTLGNNVAAAADWLPVDTRDRTPENPVTRIVVDPSGPEATVTAKSIATQKSQAIPNGLDLAPTGLGPGDTIRYTVDVQVSDYFRLGGVVLNDVLSNGQAFVAGSARLTAVERGATIGFADVAFDADNVSVARDPNNGVTSLTFRISDELVDRGDDGRLFGGRVAPFADASGTTLRLTYDALVERNYVGTTPPFIGPLNQGDTLSNSVRVSAVVLDGTNTSTGGAPADTSASSAKIAVGSPTKSVYAVNGLAPGSPVRVASGDEVTFRLTYTLPQTSTPTLTLTDFLPLPIFDAVAAAPGWSFVDIVDANAPGVNAVKWGPLAGAFNALGTPNPIITTNAAANSLSLNFGSLNPATVQGTTVDLLFTVEVKDRPFGDGLLFTNVAQTSERNTPGDFTTGVGLTQVVLNEPDLKIYKGVVAKDSTSVGTFAPTAVGPAGVTFLAPGSAGASAFTGTISSSGLAASPVRSDIANLDAGDKVTFAIVVENTGNGPRGAFEVTVKDVRPTGFLEPATAAELNMRVTNGAGTALNYTALAGGLFGTGIRIDDINTDSDPTDELGGLERYNATNGRNIVIITYDLTVAQAVEARQVLRNAAEITHYAALDGGTNRVNNEPLGDIKADATATIRAPAITKVVTSTSEPSTGLAQGDTSRHDATIGEIVDYTITITLQEGTTNNLVLSDELATTPGRLQLVDAWITHIGANLAASNGGALPFVADPTGASAAAKGVTGDRNNDGILDRVTFDFRNVRNAADNEQDVDDTITLTLRARVLNATDTAATDVLRNTAVVAFDTPGTPNPIRQAAIATADIDVVEPRLVITKATPLANVEGDQVVPYTITVRFNQAGFNSPAFDVLLRDVVNDPNLLYQPGTVGLSINGTPASPTELANSLTETANSFDLRFDRIDVGTSISITFNAKTIADAVAGQIAQNTANLTWTSLLGDAPGERSYTGTATANVPIGGVVLTKSVVWTGLDGTGIGKVVAGIHDLAIGEEVAFDVVARLSEGLTNSVSLTDELPLGSGGVLRFLSAEVISIGANLTSPGTGLRPVADIRPASDRNLDGVPDSVRVDFGTVRNTPDGIDDDKDDITLRVRALLIDAPANTASKLLTNTALATFGTNSSVTATAQVAVVEPLLALDKSAPPDYVLPGDTVSYRVTLSHSPGSTAPAYGVVLTDLLADPNLELIPGTVTTTAGSVVTGNGATDGTLRIDVSELALASSVTVTFQARVLATTPAAVTLLNTANAAFSSAPNTDGRPGSLSDTVALPVGPSFTKTIIGTSNPDTGTAIGDPALPDLAVGETVTYRLTITLPQGQAQNVVLSDTLPSGLLPQAVRVLPLGSGLTTGTPSTTINGQLVTVNFGTVQNTSPAAVDAADVIQVEVDARVTGTALTNAASFSFTIGGRTGTLTATAPADPIAPQVTIGKTVAGVSGDAGDLFTYTVTVAHGAASQMPGYDITVRDTLDPRLVPVSVSSTMGTTAIVGQLVTLNLARLAQNEQAVVTYTVRFADTVQHGQRIGNTATLGYDSNPGSGGAQGMGSASAPELLVNMPIALTKAIVATSLPDTGSAAFNPAVPDIAAGETVTYRLTATLSEGTQRLVIADTLPAGLVPESAARISIGAGISAVAPEIRRDGQLVSFDFGTVVNAGNIVGGDDVVVQVVARLAPVVAAGTPLVNAAVATVDGPDVPNSTQRAEAFAVAEVIAPQLVLAKVADLKSVMIGNTVGYTLTLSHAPGSSGPAYDVVIADPLSEPAVRLVAGSVATSSGSVTLGNAAGDSAIRVTVPVLLPGQVVTVGFRALAISAPQPDGLVPNVGSFNASSAPGVLPPGFDRPLSGSADALVRVSGGGGGVPPASLVTEGLFSGYADEFRRLRDNAFTAPAIFAGSSQPGAAVMLHLRDSEGGPITMMGVVADIGGHWIANPMQSGISGPADPNGLQLVRGLAGRPEGEDTILPPPPPPRPAPTPTTMPYTLLADHTPASFDTRGTNTDVARLTFAGSIQPGGLFAGSPEAPGIAAAGAVGAALQKDLRGLAAPMSLGWNRFALDFAAATAAASVAGR